MIGGLISQVITIDKSAYGYDIYFTKKLIKDLYNVIIHVT